MARKTIDVDLKDVIITNGLFGERMTPEDAFKAIRENNEEYERLERAAGRDPKA